MSKVELNSLTSEMCLQSLQCTTHMHVDAQCVVRRSCTVSVWLGIVSKFLDAYAHGDIHARVHVIDIWLIFLSSSFLSTSIIDISLAPPFSWPLISFLGPDNQSPSFLWGHSVIQRALLQLKLCLAFYNVSYVSSWLFYWKDTLFLVPR
jgi:hypothetical protein